MVYANAYGNWTKTNRSELEYGFWFCQLAQALFEQSTLLTAPVGKSTSLMVGDGEERERACGDFASQSQYERARGIVFTRVRAVLVDFREAARSKRSKPRFKLL